MLSSTFAHGHQKVKFNDRMHKIKFLNNDATSAVLIHLMLIILIYAYTENGMKSTLLAHIYRAMHRIIFPPCLLHNFCL